MNAIVVVDEKWGIGREGDLLVHLPGDLRYFKEKTLGKTIVVGRKTLESFPDGKPLPNRRNLVITGNREYINSSCEVFYSMEELGMELAKVKEEDLFIAGGASIYKQFLEQVDTVYVTKIFETYKADKYFENLDEKKDFAVTWKSSVQEERGIRYQFAKYERR